MKLSIITINYNNRDGLQRTIDSVICQTWRDFEWIVIDGGSTDGSKELIEKYQDHFAYWCSEPDKGVYNAMNKGIAKAHGEYLNFMNSGDTFFDENILEKVFSRQLTSDLVYGDWIRTFPDHEVVKEAPKKGFHVTVFFENVCHQAMFINSNELKEKGYDEDMKICADWKKWIEMSLEGKTFQYVPFTICKFEAGTGISEKSSNVLKDEYHQLLELMPRKIVELLENNNILNEYNSNPIISDTIKIASQGSSYKTKLIHITLIIIKTIEKIIGV